jgi:hypothetical protein
MRTISAERVAFLTAFISAHPNGLTAMEISKQTLIPRNSISDAMRELRLRGLAAATHPTGGIPWSRWCPPDQVDRVRAEIDAERNADKKAVAYRAKMRERYLRRKQAAAVMESEAAVQIIRPALECDALRPSGPRSVFELAGHS